MQVLFASPSGICLPLLTQVLGVAGVGILAGAAAWYVFRQPTNLPARRVLLGVVLLVALLLRLAMAAWDAFPNPWDEVYHMQVARQLQESPLEPRLYPAEVWHRAPLDSWTHSKWWFHKPPFSLWLMATADELFGGGLLALRMAGVLLGTATVGLIFLLGRQLSNWNAGFWAAWAAALAYFPLELAAGAAGMDVVDSTNLFLTTAIWVVGFRWLRRESPRELMLLLLLAVLAGLTRWAVGLFPFGVLGLAVLLERKPGRWHIQLLWLGMAIAAGLGAIFLWQQYSISLAPAKALWEIEYNWRHFTEVTEGNGGGPFFYLRTFPVLYNTPLLFLFPVLLFLWWNYGHKRGKHRKAFVVGVVLLYVFFSLAETKLTHYVLPGLPLVVLFTGEAIARALNRLNDLLPQRRSGGWALRAVIFAGLLFTGLALLKPRAMLRSHCAKSSQAAAASYSAVDRWLGEHPHQRLVLHGLPRFKHLYPMLLAPDRALGFDRELLPEELRYYRSKGYRIFFWPDYQQKPVAKEGI